MDALDSKLRQTAHPQASVLLSQNSECPSPWVVPSSGAKSALPSRTPTCTDSLMRSLRKTEVWRGEARTSQSTELPSVCVPWSHTPAEGNRLRANGTARPWWPSSHAAFWTSGKTRGCAAAVPRPTRAQAYASLRPSLAPAYGLLTAQAGLPLAEWIVHPLDDTRSFLKLSPLYSLSTGIAWSHYIAYAPVYSDYESTHAPLLL